MLEVAALETTTMLLVRKCFFEHQCIESHELEELRENDVICAEAPVPSCAVSLRQPERAVTPEPKLCHMFAKWIERVEKKKEKKSGRNIRAVA